MENIKLVTSNENKLKEFQRYIPSLKSEKGKDLPEVDGNKEEVAIYKAKMAGDGFLIEDTILEVDGKEIVDIRWKLNELQNNSARWITTLALNKGGSIYLYKGETLGTINTEKYQENSFGFDSVFIPHGSSQTLHEMGDKREPFSARKRAIEALVENNFYFKMDIKNIQEWKGRWQNSKN
jgi:inosine/xanthosine triphosphate pyrophosphatase family protein